MTALIPVFSSGAPGALEGSGSLLLIAPRHRSSRSPVAFGPIAFAFASRVRVRQPAPAALSLTSTCSDTRAACPCQQPLPAQRAYLRHLGPSRREYVPRTSLAQRAE